MLEAQGRLAQGLQRRDWVSAVALLLGGRGRVVVLALAIGQSQSGGHRRMVSGASLEDCAGGQATLFARRQRLLQVVADRDVRSPADHLCDQGGFDATLARKGRSDAGGCLEPI